MKRITVVSVVVVAAIIVLAAIRVFGEDTWICDNGQWIKHGNPSKPMPTSVCLSANSN